MGRDLQHARAGWEIKFWLKIVKYRDHSEDQAIDGRIGLKWILGNWGEGVDLIQLAQYESNDELLQTW